MYVQLHSTGFLRLVDPGNMRAFHASIPEGQLALFSERLGDGGRMEGDAHVWLSASLIRSLAGKVADEKWVNDFERMMAYARSQGWLDAQGRIRAHIETVPKLPNRITTQSFKSFMRRCPASVVIVATGQGAGRAGLTVSSVVSVCADPPILSVCIHRESSAYDVLVAASHIAFSFLGIGQDEIARYFAGASVHRGNDRFLHHGNWREGPLGQPILAGAAGTCECQIIQRIDIGTHTMLLAEMLAAQSGTTSPIVNFDGRFLPVL